MKRPPLQQPKPSRRVRLQLLVLLWIWAGTVFLVVDLFLDAPGLDRVRPRAPLYRAARLAAHEMVGERCHDADEFERQSARPRPPGPAPSSSEARRGPDPAVVLEQLRRQPDAGSLLEMRGDVPPDLLGVFGEAAAFALAEVLAAEPPCPADEALAGRRADLAGAAIEAQAQALLLPSPDWRSARITLERLAVAAPGYEGRFAIALSGVRQAVLRGLGPEEPLQSLAEAVRLAAACGDESVATACRRLLPSEPRRPRTREEAIVQEHAARAVARWGNEQDRVAVAVWLQRALAEEQDPARRRMLSRQIEDAALVREP